MDPGGRHELFAKAGVPIDSGNSAWKMLEVQLVSTVEQDMLELKGLPAQHEDATGIVERSELPIELFRLFQSEGEGQDELSGLFLQGDEEAVVCIRKIDATKFFDVTIFAVLAGLSGRRKLRSLL